MEKLNMKNGLFALLISFGTLALTACNSATVSQVAQQSAETQSQQQSETVQVQTSTQTQQSAVPSGVISGEVTFETDWDAVEEMPPYIYYWSDANPKMVDWPGDKLTKSGSAFSFTVPADVEYIIFNSGASAQTIDIPFDGSVTSYVVKDDIDSYGKYLVTDGSGNNINEKAAYSSTSEISSSQMKLSITTAYTTPDAYANSMRYSTGGGLDALSFNIKNSGSGKATNIKLYVICFDKDGKTVHPSTGAMDNWSLDYETDLLVLNTQKKGVDANTTDTINYECGLNGAERCEAVIAEYVLDQMLYINTDAAAWASQYITEK